MVTWSWMSEMELSFLLFDRSIVDGDDKRWERAVELKLEYDFRFASKIMMICKSDDDGNL